MRTYGRLLGALWVLLLVCPAAYSQDRGAIQEASFFTGWTFDVAPFYLWIPALDGTITVHGRSWGGHRVMRDWFTKTVVFDFGADTR
jgi:hypothetical protein